MDYLLLGVNTMSLLLLRRECQGLLDPNGLQAYHVGVVDKYMAILNECGEPLCVMKGIVFSKKVPTKAEIFYIKNKLLPSWLIKHLGTVQEYLQAKIEHEQLPRGEGESHCSAYASSCDLEDFSIKYRDNEVYVMVRLDGLINIQGSIPNVDWSLDKDLLAKKKALLEVLRVHTVSYAKVNKLRIKLGGC